MSASLLYHTNSVQGVQYQTIRYEGGAVIFVVTLRNQYVRCPKCRWHAHHLLKGKKERRLQLLPIGAKKCFLDLTIHRLQCVRCRSIWWPQPSFAAGKRRMTRSFVNYVIELMRISTIKGVANLLDISWDTVKDIHKDYLRRSYRTVEYKKLRYIGIDEFSVRKGHEYMTTVIDLETGQIIHVIEGRSKATIRPFLRKLARKATSLQAIAMDMNGPYASAVKEVLPKIKIVLDHYHVTAMVNRCIDEIRREQQQRCARAGLMAIKGMRFLLLKHYENLDYRKQKSLEALLDANKPIATAYAMKEQFRLFWLKSTRQQGMQFLVWWLMDAAETGIAVLGSLARSLLHHAEELLNYFDHRISNGITEGVNNKIKTLKRQAYGYRDMEYFKLRLYHLHKQTTALTG